MQCSHHPSEPAAAGTSGLPPATGTSLSPRQREALLLDLDDRQRELVEQLWHLSEGLITRVRVPDAVLAAPDSLAAPWSPGAVEEFHGLATGLRQVLAARDSLQAGSLGHCAHCDHVQAPAELLAAPLGPCPQCQQGAGPPSLSAARVASQP